MQTIDCTKKPLVFKKGQSVPNRILEAVKKPLKIKEGIEKKEKVAKEDNLDLNGDGKVDNKDASIASKVLHRFKKNKKEKKNKKGNK